MVVGDSRQSWTEVEYPHHAFQYVSKFKLAVLPIQEHIGTWKDEPRHQGAFVYHLGRAKFEHRAVLSHFNATTWDAAMWMEEQQGSHSSGYTVIRTFTMDDTLYSVSNNVLAASDMSGDVAVLHNAVQLIE